LPPLHHGWPWGACWPPKTWHHLHHPLEFLSAPYHEEVGVFGSLVWQGGWGRRVFSPLIHSCFFLHSRSLRCCFQLLRAATAVGSVE
jgi:hypothetical protein